MRYKKQDRVRVAAVPLWKEGAFAVIQGPFPRGLVRSLTSRSIKQASLKDPLEMCARPSSEKGYAMVMVSDLIEQENQWGPVSL